MRIKRILEEYYEQELITPKLVIWARGLSFYLHRRVLRMGRQFRNIEEKIT